MPARVYPLVVSVQAASSDGKYWGRYPQGDRPPGPPPPTLKAPVMSLSGNAGAKSN